MLEKIKTTAGADAIIPPRIPIKRMPFQIRSYNLGFLIGITEDNTVEIPISKNPIVTMKLINMFSSFTCITPRLGTTKTTWVYFYIL